MPGNAQQQPTQLVDRFDRKIDYLRLSVTDRCDLRCVYCMAEDMQFLPREHLLTLEEMTRVAAAFVSMGVRRIRLTGGEPLTRRNVLALFRNLGELPGLDDLTLTSNGSQLSRFADDLKQAGVTRINISLDSLRADRFHAITRTGELQRTLDGIDAAVAAGFKRLKLNSVIMKGRNDDEIIDLIEFVRERDMDICFIEEMPLGIIHEHDRAEVYYSSDQVLEKVQRHYDIMPTTERTAGPSRYYRIAGSDTRIGLISPHSHNFCESCNRVRLTAEGRLLLCLGQEHSVDLKQVVRANPLDDEPLRQAIIGAMDIKPRGHEFVLEEKPVLFRHMNTTGG